MNWRINAYLAAVVLAAVIAGHCSAPPISRLAPTPTPAPRPVNKTALVVEAQWYIDPGYWHREPRLARPDACPRCERVYAEQFTYGPYQERHHPFTLFELSDAMTLAGFTDLGEREHLIRIIVTCENTALDAGLISDLTAPDGQYAYGAAMVQLGWFDVAGIPRELWPSLSWNIKAAKAARDEAVRLGKPPFFYWACT